MKMQYLLTKSCRRKLVASGEKPLARQEVDITIPVEWAVKYPRSTIVLDDGTLALVTGPVEGAALWILAPSVVEDEIGLEWRNQDIPDQDKILTSSQLLAIVEGLIDPAPREAELSALKLRNEEAKK